VISKPDAVVDPGAVVVHLHNAAVADTGVDQSRWYQQKGISKTTTNNTCNGVPVLA
jgi:hypothetical protein